MKKGCLERDILSFDNHTVVSIGKTEEEGGI